MRAVKKELRPWDFYKKLVPLLDTNLPMIDEIENESLFAMLFDKIVKYKIISSGTTEGDIEAHSGRIITSRELDVQLNKVDSVCIAGSHEGFYAFDLTKSETNYKKLEEKLRLNPFIEIEDEGGYYNTRWLIIRSKSHDEDFCN